MRTTLATLLFMVTFTCGNAPVLAGKLGSVRESVREEKPKNEPQKKKKDRKKRSSSGRDRKDNDSGFSWLSFSLSLFETTPASHRKPRKPACRKPVNNTAPTYVDPASYAGPILANTSAPPQNAPSIDDGWFGRLTILGGTDFETLDHGHIAWLGQIPGSLGLDTSLTTLREASATVRDQLWLGDANLVFEPIFGDLRARIGLGFNWLHDSIGTEYGGNLTAGFDLEIWEALMVTGEVDTGALGDADFFHGQVSVGYQIGATELFAGYNYYDIGGAELDGTMFGLRFRF